ncbi:WD40-repeat-containing domain protein [Flagelloscypha sp. PMI_526]|nr:WD40-repeat-containing domain protein [Flagelloscypha sp. PMI_526]
MSIAFSPDGSRIVSGSLDHSVRVWDVETGEEIRRLDGHCLGVKSVTFSPDSTRVVSGSKDSSVRVWNITSPNDSRIFTRTAYSPASSTADLVDSKLVLPTHPMHQLNWTVNDDGWIVDPPTMNRLMWLPDALTAYLYRPANILIISQKTVKLDLAGAEFGSTWRLCHES